MSDSKPQKAAEPTIALTVVDHGAQQGFQNLVAGVAAAFREKERAREDRAPAKPAASKLTNG